MLPGYLARGHRLGRSNAAHRMSTSLQNALRDAWLSAVWGLLVLSVAACTRQACDERPKDLPMQGLRRRLTRSILQAEQLL